MKPHKHAELIKAWADGAQIQRLRENTWLDTNNPQWDPKIEFRIKPEEPQWYENIPEHGVLCWVRDHRVDKPRIRVIDRYGHHSIDFRFFAVGGEAGWKYATPLTNDEIKQFLRSE